MDVSIPRTENHPVTREQEVKLIQEETERHMGDEEGYKKADMDLYPFVDQEILFLKGDAAPHQVIEREDKNAHDNDEAGKIFKGIHPRQGKEKEPYVLGENRVVHADIHAVLKREKLTPE
jgi:hypothetical protein